MILFTMFLGVFVLLAAIFSAQFRRFFIKHRLVAATAIALLVVVALVSPMAAKYFSVDACLDSGGRWNEFENKCEYEKKKKEVY
ncbi:hypothetical protein DET64_103298 [Marinobacter nauticus]|uniref:Uncharacterized protein n=2 Tax=Marinobacter nauticus TaxID=2743 RepID=A0A368V8A6_MARNT|nr:hypothetical protein DET64_103298 [Marinobacter nauticus]RCW36505.1 hypothetical protein DET51_103298 [Marinobacter nauticus]